MSVLSAHGQSIIFKNYGQKGLGNLNENTYR